MLTGLAWLAALAALAAAGWTLRLRLAASVARLSGGAGGIAAVAGPAESRARPAAAQPGAPRPRCAGIVEGPDLGSDVVIEACGGAVIRADFRAGRDTLILAVTGELHGVDLCEETGAGASISLATSEGPVTVLLGALSEVPVGDICLRVADPGSPTLDADIPLRLALRTARRAGPASPREAAPPQAGPVPAPPGPRREAQTPASFVDRLEWLRRETNRPGVERAARDRPSDRIRSPDPRTSS